LAGDAVEEEDLRQLLPGFCSHQPETLASVSVGGFFRGFICTFIAPYDYMSSIFGLRKQLYGNKVGIWLLKNK
jgi:hypothetical protein